MMVKSLLGKDSSFGGGNCDHVNIFIFPFLFLCARRGVIKRDGEKIKCRQRGIGFKLLDVRASK
jgi:hypothetical protein